MTMRPDSEADALSWMTDRPEPARPAPAAPVRTDSAAPIAPATNGQALLALVLVAATGAACIWGGLWTGDRLADPDSDSPARVEAIYTAAIFLPLLLLSVAGGLAFRSPGLGAGRDPARWSGLGLLIGAGGMLLATLYAWLAGLARPGETAALVMLPYLGGTLLFLLQAASEEVLLRGWLQPVLARRWRAWAAVATSAALFAALHLVGEVRSFVTLLNLLLAGLLFGLLALRTGGLAAPIVAHFAWNWTEAMLLGLTPNPGAHGFGTLWNLELVGAPNWGGGEEGLNASWGVAVVFAALCLAVLRQSGQASSDRNQFRVSTDR
jgi:uncharacterized protein